ncbi:uncharacterized protein LOC122535274 [Frieseomelitta varia]|uniref:uncharacterized protein LOC122535274 n=1 Tax=Frieseomelitta varia TaxID=561572 RepID=UPI001CB697D5|nr:uncharacterized protein LOC122535274 [Frieseomelitta varia]
MEDACERRKEEHDKKLLSLFNNVQEDLRIGRCCLAFQQLTIIEAIALVTVPCFEIVFYETFQTIWMISKKLMAVSLPRGCMIILFLYVFVLVGNVKEDSDMRSIRLHEKRKIHYWQMCSKYGMQMSARCVDEVKMWKSREVRLIKDNRARSLYKLKTRSYIGYTNIRGSQMSRCEMVKRFDKLCFYEIFNVITSPLQLKLLYQVSPKYKNKNYREISVESQLIIN